MQQSYITESSLVFQIYFDWFTRLIVKVSKLSLQISCNFYTL